MNDNRMRAPPTDAFPVVRSFTRFLSLGAILALGVSISLIDDSLAAGPVPIGFIPAGGVAWFLAGWWTRAALLPMPSTVERGMVVGLAVAAVASVGIGLELAENLVKESDHPSLGENVWAYVVGVGMVAACCAVPGAVLGAVLGLFVHARAWRAIHQPQPTDRDR